MTASQRQDKMIIGCDPDCDRSGVAVKQNNLISLYNLSFFELFEYLQKNKDNILKVRIEASWLISFNWNKKQSGSAAINASIGNAAGRNHETGRKIVEMCVYLEIPYEEVRPLRKSWKGTNGKITHEELKRMVPNLPNRTNQEVRDAALLIL